METQEQNTDTEERGTVEASDKELLDAAASKEQKDTVSKSPETSEDKAQDAEGEIQYAFKSKDELLAHPEVKKLSQSALDAKAKNRDLEAKVSDLSRQLNTRQTNEDKAILEGHDLESNGEEHSKKFSAAFDRFQKARQYVDENFPKLTNLEEREQKLWVRETVADFIDSCPAASSDREKLISESSDAKTEKERVTLLRAWKAEYGVKTEEKKSHKPDSTKGSAGGGYSDQIFIEKFSTGDIPINKETLKRAKALGLTQ